MAEEVDDERIRRRRRSEEAHDEEEEERGTKARFSSREPAEERRPSDRERDRHRHRSSSRHHQRRRSRSRSRDRGGGSRRKEEGGSKRHRRRSSRSRSRSPSSDSGGHGNGDDSDGERKRRRAERGARKVQEYWERGARQGGGGGGGNGAGSDGDDGGDDPSLLTARNGPRSALVPHKFVWVKKVERDLAEGRAKSVRDFAAEAEEERHRGRLEEIARVQQRRAEKEAEREAGEREAAELQRQRAAAEAVGLDAKEDEFHLQQALVRASRRISQGRARAVDLLFRELYRGLGGGGGAGGDGAGGADFWAGGGGAGAVGGDGDDDDDEEDGMDEGGNGEGGDNAGAARRGERHYYPEHQRRADARRRQKAMRRGGGGGYGGGGYGGGHGDPDADNAPSAAALAREPYLAVERLGTLAELREARDDAREARELDARDPLHARYWRALCVVADAAVSRAEERRAAHESQRRAQPGARGGPSSSSALSAHAAAAAGAAAAPAAVHAQVDRDVEELLRGQGAKELAQLRSGIEAQLRAGEGDPDYWSAVLERLGVAAARAELKEAAAEVRARRAAGRDAAAAATAARAHEAARREEDEAAAAAMAAAPVPVEASAAGQAGGQEELKQQQPAAEQQEQEEDAEARRRAVEAAAAAVAAAALGIEGADQEEDEGGKGALGMEGVAVVVAPAKDDAEIDIGDDWGEDEAGEDGVAKAAAAAVAAAAAAATDAAAAPAAAAAAAAAAPPIGPAPGPTMEEPGADEDDVDEDYDDDDDDEDGGPAAAAAAAAEDSDEAEWRPPRRAPADRRPGGRADRRGPDALAQSDGRFSPPPVDVSRLGPGVRVVAARDDAAEVRALRAEVAARERVRLAAAERAALEAALAPPPGSAAALAAAAAASAGAPGGPGLPPGADPLNLLSRGARAPVVPGMGIGGVVSGDAFSRFRLARQAPRSDDAHRLDEETRRLRALAQRAMRSAAAAEDGGEAGMAVDGEGAADFAGEVELATPTGGGGRGGGGGGGAAAAAALSGAGGALLAARLQRRRPRYFNRVTTGYDWNRYNRTHYDRDNPPPKVVQGYKFNVFYPDLIDKTKAPTYRVERDPEAGAANDTCILRFCAGPPYEDVAFRVVNKEWEVAQRRGFRCTFERGILHLWFNFKRAWYKR